MRKVLPILIILTIFLSACGNTTTKPKVALMLARGGLDDKAFNDSANEGLQKAAQELGAEVATFYYAEDVVEANIRQAAGDGYNLIIGLGSENSEAIAKVAKEFPETKFAIIDAAAEGDNVTSVTFSELEGDFLAGALSALMSDNGKVGYLGGADVLVIRRIQFGFEQGVKYINPNAEIVVQYIGGKDDFSGFAKPDEAKTLATQMYVDGVDIIYAAAGGSTLGAIEAAESAGMPIITTGSDQRYLAPNVVATSRTKNMNEAVFMLIQKFADNSLQNGPIQLDYKSGGIGLAPLADFVPATVIEEFASIQTSLDGDNIEIQPFTGQ